MGLKLFVLYRFTVLASDPPEVEIMEELQGSMMPIVDENFLLSLS